MQQIRNCRHPPAFQTLGGTVLSSDSEWEQEKGLVPQEVLLRVHSNNSDKTQGDNPGLHSK